MLKFVVVGDVHYRGSNPRSRIDDYPAAIRAKIQEVNELARRIEARSILCPGDLFDSPNLGYSTVGDLYDVLHTSADDVPWTIIPGNHDEYAANPETLQRTPFGLLRKVGFFVVDPSEKVVRVDRIDGPPTLISGHAYDTETDLDPKQYCPRVDAELEPEFWDGGNCRVVRIHLVHGMAVDRPMPDLMRHTQIQNVETAADVIITGHDHTGYGIRRIGKTLWINPGALCRVSASATEMERTIQIAVLTVHDDGTCDAELVPLQSARPGHEVLSREHLEQQAMREQHTAEFLALLAGAGEALDPAQLVDVVARQQQIPEPVRAEALKRLGQAKEKLGVSA